MLDNINSIYGPAAALNLMASGYGKGMDALQTLLSNVAKKKLGLLTMNMIAEKIHLIESLSSDQKATARLLD